MIVFCEECGEKNQLKTVGPEQGRVAFQCCSCHYMNFYAISTLPQPKERLLNAIGSVPGIIGGFLYHVRTNSITSHMLDILNTDDLKVLGHYLTRSYLSARAGYSDIHGATIVISKKQITIQMVEPDLFILLVSKPFALTEPIEGLLAATQRRGPMMHSECLPQISKVKGVDQYIFVDHGGKIIAHEISNPQKAGKMVFSCGQNIQTIGKNRFSYAIFSRENKKDILIFFNNTYFLGVFI